MMKKITMWILTMAMAVSPILAQQAESKTTEEEQPVNERPVNEQPVEEQVSESATAVEEQVSEPAVADIEQISEEPAELTEEEQVDQAIEEATGEVWVDEALEEESLVEEEEIIEEEEGPLLENLEENNDNRPQHREVQTLMSGGGGYGALSIGYTQVNGLNALQMGVQAEWLVGHGFGLGIAGVGFTSDFTPVNSDYYALSGGYGGLIMEPIIFGWLPVHISLPVLFGGGGMASYSTNADPWNNGNVDPMFGEYAVFFVGEVGVELEFNMVRFFRLSLFGNYRWTTNLDMKPMYGLDEVSPYAVSPDALNGWSAGVRFKFGSF